MNNHLNHIPQTITLSSSATMSFNLNYLQAGGHLCQGVGIPVTPGTKADTDMNVDDNLLE